MTLYCGIDLETPQDNPEYGLQPWRALTGEATIKSIALYCGETLQGPGQDLNGTIRMPTVKHLRGILRYAAKNGIVLVGWNVLFDIAWLLAYGLEEEVKACRWLDAMLLLKRVDGWRSPEYGGQGYGLKVTVVQEYGDDYGIGDDVVRVPETEEEWARLLEYNLKDSTYTYALCMRYLNLLSAEERRGARVEAMGLVPVAGAYIQGIAINVPAIAELQESVLSARAQATMEFQHPDASVVASPKKLGELLFETWGFKPVKYTPKGAPATDKESLLKLAIAHPEDIRFRALMVLRKCNTQQSKFIDGVSKSMEYHGAPITRPAPFIAGTYSGRMTYASTQTIKATPKGKKDANES